MILITGVAGGLGEGTGPDLFQKPHVRIDIAALDLMPGDRGAPQETRRIGAGSFGFDPARRQGCDARAGRKTQKLSPIGAKRHAPFSQITVLVVRATGRSLS